MNFNGGIIDISPLLKFSICVFFVALSGIAGAQVPGEIFHPPEFTGSDEIVAQSGYFQIEWKEKNKSKQLLFELQQASSPEFSRPTTVYQGSENASFISGIPDGEYYYRIRQTISGKTTGWSKPIKVKVKHHPLSLAWLLFSMGGLVFLATAVLVIHGSIKSAKE